MTTVSFHPPSAYNCVVIPRFFFYKNLCTPDYCANVADIRCLYDFSPQILLVTSPPEILGEFCWKCKQVGLNVKCSFLVQNRNVFAAVEKVPKYQTAADSEHC